MNRSIFQLTMVAAICTLGPLSVMRFVKARPGSNPGAISPLEIGFSLWVLVVATRWFAEHIALINSKKGSHED